ncbi:MAG: ketopantoate reductase family protein [Spirochaetota bacterium]
MENDQIRVAVVGCGGIGGVIAGVLARKLEGVACVTGREDSALLLNRNGVHVTGKKGEFVTRVHACSTMNMVNSSFDIIIIAVKSNQLGEVFKETKDYLDENGFILTVQNGVEMLKLKDEYPDVKLLAGAVGYNAIMLDYGKYHVTTGGGITIGVLSRGSYEDVLLLKKLLEPEIRVKYTKNPEGLLWSKLIIVCGVTGLGGVSGLLTGELLRYRVSRRLFYAIATEGSMVARKLGIKLEKFGGAINPERFSNDKRGFPIFIRYLLLRLIGVKYRNLKSNIHHSIERNKPTEVYYLNGAIVREGERLGIETPFNRGVVRVIEEIERHERSMDVKNLYDIWEIFT